ncbi:unnamed protein product [Euphydryas editha]|uniref:RecQ-mediated genome instability protein 2 n=1 Tax=Euphydryas editha TaxID=104508 RepID=A0AAU9TVD5_EUPED|nr:unnamed protein product [Euphydryas editha]
MTDNKVHFNPKKYLNKDLTNKSPPLDVWLQGTIEQTVGNDILIISDSSGRVKVVKCNSADGLIDKTSLCKGTYCCILGVARKTTGLPEVEAIKFIDLTSQPQIKTAWEADVREAELVLEGKFTPKI